MQKPKQIVVIDGKSGGSPFGWSGKRKWLKCSWRAKLEQERPELVKDNKRLLIGSIFHAFVELYRTTNNRTIDTNCIELSCGYDYGDLLEQCKSEAERLFRFYRSLYAPDSLGSVVATELDIAGEFGNEPLTCRIDLVTKVGVKDLHKLTSRGVVDPKPGYYIVDYKTADYITESLEPKYKFDTQFIVQELLWKQQKIGRSLAGKLVEIITKTKTPSVKLVNIPLNTAQSSLLLSDCFDKIKEAKKNPQKNPEHCFDYNSSCQFLNICRKEIVE